MTDKHKMTELVRRREQLKIDGEEPQQQQQQQRLDEMINRRSFVVNTPVDFSFCSTLPSRAAPSKNQDYEFVYTTILSKL